MENKIRLKIEFSDSDLAKTFVSTFNGKDWEGFEAHARLFDKQQEKIPSFSDYIDEPRIKINLSVLILSWTTCCFGYYSILLILPKEDLYTSTYYSGLIDLTACLMVGVFVQLVGGLKTCLISLNTVTAASALCLCLAESQTWPMIIMVKLGVMGAFNLVYISNALVFPTLFSATAIGICNIIARLVSIFVPYFAQIRPNVPLWILVVLSCATVIANVFS